jgi:hypothetical protein
MLVSTIVKDSIIIEPVFPARTAARGMALVENHASTSLKNYDFTP